MTQWDVVIIGAGAAGLMCAIEAGKRGRRVLVLDHANKPGKKILMSGGGRCNFTNLSVEPENFISHNPHFCRSALSRYTSWQFIDLVEKHEIAYHEKTLGQLFCSGKSKEIVELLLAECAEASVTIQLNTPINTIRQKAEGGFLLDTSQGHVACQSLVIATGGLSIPTMGASPFGYKVAEQFSLTVHPTRAALVPFTLHDQDKNHLSDLVGVAVPCEVSVAQQQFREGMLFTHRGLSAPAMLQISSYWQAGETLSVNFLPDEDLFALLVDAQKQTPTQLLKNVLTRYFPKRFVSVWLTDAEQQKTLADCSNVLFREVADRFQAWQIRPNNTEGYRTAEVTLGGVDCDALSSKTFEVKTIPGLYFIGEVLDVTGWLGGYNFQWAWASGYAAGQCC